MKRKFAIIGIALIFLAGICVMGYPLFSSIVNNMASRRQIEEYSETTKLMSSEETLALLQEGKDYNDSLTNNVVITDPFDVKAYEKTGAKYENSLDVDGNGLIGYIDIPKINVYLPISHGTTDEVLAKSAGHLQNTSFPIGGESTHSVISAHTAYPGETFFDYLTDMVEGDEFYVHVLDRTLKYEVDQIKVVLPNETDDLRIVTGEDYVTLLTCTPYSLNTHRLLVRGKRVEYDDSRYITKSASAASFGEDGIFFLGYKIPYWAAAMIIAGVIFVVVILVVYFSRKSNRKNKHLSDDKKTSENGKDGG